MPKYYSKIVINNETKIDLTADTVDAEHLLSGYTAHGNDGAPVEGSCTYDADTSDATAIASEILNGETAYVNGVKVTGSMPNRGAVSGEISNANTGYSVPQGYHDGSGSVDINATEKAKLIPSNIKSGVSILGVVGDYSGEAATVESNKDATPSFSQQVITPSSGYDYLAQVTVKPIVVTETLNAQGGYTLTI